MERLLRAKDFQEALGIQVEHFQSQFDGGSRGGNSDRRMDSWPGEFTQAFFWLADVSLIAVAAIGRV